MIWGIVSVIPHEMAASLLNPIYAGLSLPSLFFFSIKTLISPIRSVLFLNTPTSPLKSLALASSNPNPHTGSPPEPITIHPHLHRLHHWFPDPPSLHCLCTQTNVQMHSLALFLELVFKFDIFFAAAGKRPNQLISFWNLRERFKLDAAAYMMSICGDDGLREISSPGKSGSVTLQGELLIPPKGLLLVTHEPGSVSTAPGPHIRGSPLKAYSLGDKEVNLLLPGTGRLRVQLGVDMPARANRKIVREEVNSTEVELFEFYDVVLYMGIIDILQEYNENKKLEHAYKSSKFDPQRVSAVEPELYAKRFINFLEKVFPVLP